MGKRSALERLAAVLAADDRQTARGSKDGARRVEGKYGKLRRSPYKLFRATNPLFIADLESLPEFWRMPCHELRGPLVGDAHPENFGAVGASAAAAQMDCTDFDVVAEGPLARDVARAACGLAIACDQSLPKDKADDKALARALESAPSEKALARVRLLGAAWASRIVAGQGGLPDAAAFAEQLAAVDLPVDQIQLGESTHEVTAHPGSAAVEAALAGYAETAPAVRGARFVRAWLLHGKGASSFCVDRTVLEIELAGGGRRIVEWKPQPDAPTVALAFRERRSPATVDPLLGLASLGGVGHVAQRWLTEGQKVKSKDLSGGYADEVARLCAVRLADLHARAAPQVVERLRGQAVDAVAEALADLVAAYLPLIALEWRAFLSLSPAELRDRVAA